jgi:hypothetical protein
MTHVRARARALAVVTVLLGVLLTGCGPTKAAPRASSTSPSASPTESGAPSPTVAAPSSVAGPAQVAVPSGVTAGVAVYDRKIGAFTVQHNIDQRFRSASLVKLLIAIDYLWDRPTVPDSERQRLRLMLSRSDDNSASYFYDKGGRAAIITRMNQRLGLTGNATIHPPTAPRTGWGATEISAAHLVRIYRYLLDEGPERIRSTVLDSLRQGTFTRCGTDGYDQSFGVPTTFKGRPWIAKQGWYEFKTAPRTCTSNVPAALVVDDHATATEDGAGIPAGLAVPAAGPVNWTGEVLHTTGVIGPDERTIVVVLTVHPAGTSYAVATERVTKIAAALPVPAA